MISGRTVTVYTPTVAGVDRFGEPIPGTPIETEVPNVLIVPGGTSDLEASRPDGVNVALTLHFPKTFTGNLRGCEVEITGEYSGARYRVIGEPMPYLAEDTPTDWYMPVEVERCDG